MASVASSEIQYRSGPARCTLQARAGDGVRLYKNGELVRHFDEDFVRSTLVVVEAGASEFVDAIEATQCGPDPGDEQAVLAFLANWRIEHYE